MLSLTSAMTALAIRPFQAAMRAGVRTTGRASASHREGDHREPQQQKPQVGRQPDADGCRPRRPNEAQAGKADSLGAVTQEQVDEDGDHEERQARERAGVQPRDHRPAAPRLFSRYPRSVASSGMSVIDRV